MNSNSQSHSGIYFIVLYKIVKITDLHLFEDINQFAANIPFLYTFQKSLMGSWDIELEHWLETG